MVNIPRFCQSIEVYAAWGDTSGASAVVLLNKSRHPMKDELPEKELLSLYRGFYIFGDATCLKILYELQRFGEKNFTELKHGLGVNPSTLTKKLRLLVDADIITADRSRDRLRIYYTINNHHKSLKRFLDAFERLSLDLSHGNDADPNVS